MALIPENKYPGQTQAGDANYPQGSAVNDSSPGAFDGTPFEKDWVNDAWGFLQALLAAANITPSGNPDTVQASDYFNSMLRLFISRNSTTTTGTGTAYALNLSEGSLVVNRVYIVNFHTQNTGVNPTLNIDGQGSNVIRHVRGDAVLPGTINGVHMLVWTGAEFVVLNPASKKATTSVFTSTMTWNNPGCVLATVIALAPGGAGGGAVATGVDEASCGSGGGGGGKAVKQVDVSGVASVLVTIGEGGLPVIGADGGDGGDVSFGSYVSATAGKGGIVSSAGTGTSGTATAGDGGEGVGGDLNFKGSAGFVGLRMGNAAPSIGSGVAFSGHGGSSANGSGGAQQNLLSLVTGRSGHFGGLYGGGGSGAVNGPSQSSRPGGPGGPGIIIVQEYYQ